MDAAGPAARGPRQRGPTRTASHGHTSRAGAGPGPLVRLAGVLLVLAAPLTAQRPAESVPPVSIGSDHWVYPLVDRMAADGLLDGVWLPGRRPMGADAIMAVMDSAVARAGDGSPWTATARAARDWLGGEYGVGASGGFRVLPVAGARLGGGPRTDPGALLAGARLLYRPAADVGLWADPVVELGADGVALPVPRLGAAWRVGAFRLVGGYDAQRLGPGAGGGIVVHDAAALGRVEAALAEPVVLPWLLRYLGPFQLSVSAARIGPDSLGPAVGLFSSAARIQPHPRVTLGVYRSAAIAAEVDGQRPGPGDLWRILFDSGRTTPNFEDQKLSFGGSVRADLVGVTVMPYFVWGIEDTWEIDRDPAAILGAWLPSIPVGDGAVGLRYEYTAFGDRGRIIWPWAESWEIRNWYRHSTGRSAYVDNDGRLLGHPLGGYGHEHRLDVDVPVPGKGLLVRAALFARDREQGIYAPESDPEATRPYSNLLYDELPGRSRGGQLRAALATAGFRLDGEITVELGDGWDRATGSIRGTWLLP